MDEMLNREGVALHPSEVIRVTHQQRKKRLTKLRQRPGVIVQRRKTFRSAQTFRDHTPSRHSYDSMGVGVSVGCGSGFG
jgi:hypothetical protein